EAKSNLSSCIVKPDSLARRRASDADAVMASSTSGPLLLGEPTRGSTGQAAAGPLLQQIEAPARTLKELPRPREQFGVRVEQQTIAALSQARWPLLQVYTRRVDLFRDYATAAFPRSAKSASKLTSLPKSFAGAQQFPHRPCWACRSVQ